MQKRYADNGLPNTAPDGEVYRPDEKLTAAVNVALLLGKPLLVTGEAGTGKTALAKSVAADLQLPLIEFYAKSVSESRDLLYQYDAIGHFRQAQLKQGSDPDPIPHLKAHALGEAILRAAPPGEDDPLRQLLDEWEKSPTASVVLIDEIDKAPRDFPNDLLLELDKFQFDIPEIGRGARFKIEDESLKPVVIITSNSEKNLPDAFLRRCVYHDIQFPSGDAARKRMEEIVMSRASSVSDGPEWLSEAVDFFLFVRERFGSRLAKKPATAELLDLVRVVAAAEPSGTLLDSELDPPIEKMLGVVFKTGDDLSLADDILSAWKELKS